MSESGVDLGTKQSTPCLKYVNHPRIDSLYDWEDLYIAHYPKSNGSTMIYYVELSYSMLWVGK